MKGSFQPGDGFIGAVHDVASGFFRPCDHDDRQAKVARRFDLGVGRSTSGILGDDDVDLLVFQQTGLAGTIKRSPRLQEANVGRQDFLLRRIDGARDVVMLRRRREGVQVETPQAEKHPTRRRTEGRRGCIGVAHDMPVIASLGLPGRSRDRNQRNAGSATGGDGVGRNLVGVGMRRIDDYSDRMIGEEAGKAVGAAEAADARRSGRRSR